MLASADGEELTVASTISEIRSKDYVCGHCNNQVASNRGFSLGTHRQVKGGRLWVRGIEYVRLCPHCGRPTYFPKDGRPIPAPLTGGDVGQLPTDVAALYTEARRAIQAETFTAAVLSCRKLLMHVAVDKGAPTSRSFAYYVQFLDDKRYIPPNARGWVDQIRQRSNEANHEIVVMNEEDATLILNLAEMLLKLVYEYPAKPSKPSRKAST